MNYCICVQCFNKPVETLLVLESLEKCDKISKINLLLFIDKANESTKSFEKNNELINKLYKYKKNKENLYKSIIIKISDSNLGPYKACFQCVENAFEISENVIFTEDDI